MLARSSDDDQTLEEGFHRLRAELVLEGFAVEVVHFAEPPSPRQTRNAARAAQAFAALVLVRTGGEPALDIWTTDRITGEMVLQTLHLDDVKDAPSVLALRAVDLLRNHLLESGPQSARLTKVADAPAAPRTSRPVETRPVVERVRDYRVHLGALVLSAGALGEGWGANLGLHRRLGQRLRAGLSFGTALLGASWSTRLGVARTHQEVLLAEASYELVRLGALTVSPLVGGGAYRLAARGEVAPPLLAQEDAVLSGAVVAGLGLDVRLTPLIVLSGRAQGMLLTPRPGIQLDDERVLLAPLLLMASLGLGAEF